jgi:hypothetical protein
MIAPKNCAVVTLANGAAAIFHNADADIYERGELTITDRVTFAERIYQAGAWDAVTVYDAQGHYLYVIDQHPRLVVFDTVQGAA